MPGPVGQPGAIDDESDRNGSEFLSSDGRNQRAPLLLVHVLGLLPQGFDRVNTRRCQGVRRVRAPANRYATFGTPKCCCTTSVTAPRKRGCVAGSVGTMRVLTSEIDRLLTTSSMMGPTRSHAAV